MSDTNENTNASIDCELYNMRRDSHYKSLNLIEYDIVDIEFTYPRHITIYTDSFNPNLDLYYDNNRNDLTEEWIRTDKDHIYYNVDDIYVNLEHKKLILINHYIIKKYKEEITDLGFINLKEVSLDKFDGLATY